VRDYLTDLFDWGGFAGIEAEELLVFPGMDELFALAEVQDHVRSGRYDLVVVDCAPTAETLRLLSLPEALAWYMEKLYPLERRVARVVRPVLSRVISMPLPDDDVFEAGEGFYGRIEGARRIFGNPRITSARLVVNLEKMVIAEARRTYTYLGLFGYAVDAAVVNRILPDEVTDPYFKRWREVQQEHLAAVEEAFADVAVLGLRLFEEEMVGVDRLRLVGEELYGERDPVARFSEREPFQITREEDGEVTLTMSVPFAERGEVDLFRHHDELLVTIGSYRRSMVLPDSLRRREVRGARLAGGSLTIRFGARDG
jgi:arsenite-transporting ATPase